MRRDSTSGNLVLDTPNVSGDGHSGAVTVASGTAAQGNTGGVLIGSGSSHESGDVSIRSGYSRASGHILVGSSDALNDSGNVLVTSGSVSRGDAGSIILSTGVSEKGLAGSISIKAGETSGAMAIDSCIGSIAIQAGLDTKRSNSGDVVVETPDASVESGSLRLNTGKGHSSGDIVIGSGDAQRTAAGRVAVSVGSAFSDTTGVSLQGGEIAISSAVDGKIVLDTGRATTTESGRLSVYTLPNESPTNTLIVN